MIKLLWVDDVRNPFIKEDLNKNTLDIEWVRSYEEFVTWISMYGLPDIISFDHDLGVTYTGQEKTGYDCAKYLVNFCMDNNEKLPRFVVHSANPVGRDNIMKFLLNYSMLQK